MNAHHKQWTGCVEALDSKVLHFRLTIDGPQEGHDIFPACGLTGTFVFVVEARQHVLQWLYMASQILHELGHEYGSTILLQQREVFSERLG